MGKILDWLKKAELSFRGQPEDGEKQHIARIALSDGKSVSDPTIIYSVRWLAENYQTTEGYILRGMEASHRAGISPDYFVTRYLHLRSIPRNEDFEMHWLDIINEETFLASRK